MGFPSFFYKIFLLFGFFSNVGLFPSISEPATVYRLGRVRQIFKSTFFRFPTSVSSSRMGRVDLATSPPPTQSSSSQARLAEVEVESLSGAKATCHDMHCFSAKRLGSNELHCRLVAVCCCHDDSHSWHPEPHLILSVNLRPPWRIRYLRGDCGPYWK